MRGIDRNKGAVVVVRPDQYVALVTPSTAVQTIEEFIAQALSL